MKGKLLISIGVIVFFSLLFFVPRANAAEQFVTNIYTDETTSNSIRLCWTIADVVEDLDASYPQFQTSHGDLLSDDYIVILSLGGDEKISDTKYCRDMIGLSEGTDYQFWIKYKGSNLSGYLDYVASLDRIESVVYKSSTVNTTARFTSVDKTYVMPGDTVRLYGTGLGNGPDDLIGQIARLGSDEYTASKLDSGYEFEITDWTNKYIEFTVPEYNSAMEISEGKLYLDNLIVSESNYNSDISIKLVTDETDVDRAIESGYQGGEYRYLLNASRYRYNIRRTVGTLSQERNQMEWVGDYLTSIGKGIDATWSLVLAYGRVYGGYSEVEIQKEIKFGPGCIHAIIPQSAWSQTNDYAVCMSHTL
ncbi:MAG: hypothetical protein WC693_02150 [Patescibacteria group bacterium]|jgi:hypothetical protein